MSRYVINDILEDKLLMRTLDDILYLIAGTYDVSHSKACELIGELGKIAKLIDLEKFPTDEIEIPYEYEVEEIK
jgi:hypothetical protein